MPPPGKQFEEVIERFVRSLDPQAQIKFDVQMPDADTGTLRQADGWVVFKLLNHFPISMLISCKDYHRPLSIEHIDHFLSEKQAVRANAGVIYSRAGFTEPAIEKAKKHNVSCCRYFDDAPPELPAELLIEAYMAFPRYRIVCDAPSAEAASVHWQRVLRHDASWGVWNGTMADALVQRCAQLHQRGCAASKGTGPKDLMDVFDIPESSSFPAMRLHITLYWKWFVASMDAFRLQGSWNQSQPDFKGKVTTPVFPFQGGGPSAAWKECPPPDENTPNIRMTSTALWWPDTRHLLAEMGPCSLFRSAPWEFAPAEAIPNWTSFGATGMQMTVVF